MVVDNASGEPIPEHPLLAKLLAHGGSDLKAYRGYVGASVREGYVSVYPNLADLGKNFEIRGSDIVHTEPIPDIFGPFGALMIWVRADAEVAARVVATASRKAEPTAVDLIENRQDRLRILRQAPMQVGAEADTCTSNCECVSNCDPCISTCRWTCQTRPT